MSSFPIPPAESTSRPVFQNVFFIGRIPAECGLFEKMHLILLPSVLTLKGGFSIWAVDLLKPTDRVLLMGTLLVKNNIQILGDRQISGQVDQHEFFTLVHQVSIHPICPEF